MQLTCPNCGERIPSENINIQQMTAVCPTCSSVFVFEPPGNKSKRRKVKQPKNLTIRESDEQLSLAFRTNFRLEKNEAFLSTGIFSLIFTFLTAATTGAYIFDDAPFFIPLGFALVTFFLYYLITLMIYNQTHIDINEESIHISRKPISDLANQPRAIHLSGIERIRYAETTPSIREGYDTPRYNVWAEMIDGSRKIIVTDVIDDYAVFLAQRLNEYLDLDSHVDILRLTDSDQALDEEQISNESHFNSQADRGVSYRMSD